jgi:ribosomal protein L16 Arg81 hydroxylase
MQTFKDLLNPISIQDFTNNLYNKTAYHIKGNKSKFKKLFSWQDLNNTLNTSVSENIKSKFRMFNNRESVGFNDTFDIIKNTQKGATLIVEDIDRTNIKLGKLHDSIENEIGENTRSNLYLAFPSVRGFGIHYDTHDFLILQLFGKKRWKVYPSTIEQPLFHLKNHATNQPPNEDSIYLDCVLEQGDVLYVPKGHWHEVIAEGDELSVHLTLAMFIRTGIDFLSWITNELREIPLFRSSFPLTTDDETKSKKHIIEMNTALNNILNQPDIYDTFMQSRFANFKNRTVFNYPYHIFENSFEQNKNSQIIKSLTPVHISTTNDQIIITAPRTLIKFPIELKKAIEYIYNSKTDVLNMEFLFNTTTNEKLIKDTIEKLISEGLLRKKE